MDKFWNKYPEMNCEIEKVIVLIRRNSKCKQKLVEDAILDLVNSGGKFLRPAFLILASKFGNKTTENVYSLAAVVEMLHMATLVHDDVIDESQLRRGKETVQSKHGNNFAVYVGDYLFCMCFKILSETSSIKKINVDSNVMSKICVGEIEQFSSKFNTNITVRQYLKRISAKTAELFALSFYTGATETECDKKTIKLLTSIGRNIGMAFQIIDDILDFNGEENIVGKTNNNDLRQGVFTLPVIFALEEDNEYFLKLISSKIYSDNDVKTIIDRINTCGAMIKSKQLAKAYTDKAFSGIEKLPNIKSKELLLSITEGLLYRKY